MIVYLIENKISGKRYVGQTTGTLHARWVAHRRAESKGPLARAIKSYGADKFSVSVLSEAVSIDELNVLERFWINKLGTLSPAGYNLREGGYNGKHSMETRSRLAALHRDPEFRDKHRSGIRRYLAAPDNMTRLRAQCAAMREKKAGVKMPPRQPWSEEAKASHSVQRKEIWRSETKSKNMTAWRSDPARVAKWREAIKASLDRKKQDPQWVAFRSADMKRVRREVLERRSARKEGGE